MPAIWLSRRCQDSGFLLQHEPSKDIPALLSPTCGRAMTSLGYERFFASGGDIGARVTSWLGVRHPQRVRGIHVSSNALRRPLPGEVVPTADQRPYLAQNG